MNVRIMEVAILPINGLKAGPSRNATISLREWELLQEFDIGFIEFANHVSKATKLRADIRRYKEEELSDEDRRQLLVSLRFRLQGERKSPIPRKVLCLGSRDLPGIVVSERLFKLIVKPEEANFSIVGIVKQMIETQ